MNKDHTFNPAGQPAGQPASKPRGDGPGFDAGMSRINVPGMEGVVAPGSIPGALDQAVVDRLFQMGISTPQRPIDHLVQRLSGPGSSAWLGDALRMPQVGCKGDPESGLARGRFNIREIDDIKERCKIAALTDVDTLVVSEFKVEPLVQETLLDRLCLAPYIYGGGGCHVDGRQWASAHGGVGLEYRIKPNQFGVFIDGRWTYLGDRDERSDLNFFGARAGFRVIF